MQLPTIETPLLLDLLFGVIVLLFVPFGARRGAGREAIVAAGLLLAAAVAAAWVEAWGAWLAQQVALDPNLARFVVTVGILLVGWIGIGWIGGAAMAGRPGIASRLAGGLLAALNGAFLLAQILAAIERDLQVGAISGSVVGGELLRDRDRLLLGAALLGLVIAVVARLTRSMRSEPAANDFGFGVGSRQRPVRLAAGADAGKYEPEAAAGVPPLDETTPLPRRPEGTAGRAANDGAWWRPSPPAPRPSNGHRPTGLPEDWSQAAESGASWQARRDQAYNRTVEFPASGAAGRRFGGSSQPDQGADDRERCPTCGAHVTGNDLFCPSCGKTL
ncbi:MAG TPA: zinc ribbon domain-containing protein [Thermomicrobiales bacterium]|nr:zinc ribbon domain-containing protein [Thermomicrobiales bacterium]